MRFIITERFSSIVSRLRFSEKSRSISTDNLGRLNIVRFIAVPPFNARQDYKISSLSKNFKIPASLQPFSKVSLTNPSSFACLPIVFLSNCIIFTQPFVCNSFNIFWSKQLPFFMPYISCMVFCQIAFCVGYMLFALIKKTIRQMQGVIKSF